MTDRPILFSAPMVRALLAGTKTQTRRIVKLQPPPIVDGVYRPFTQEPDNWQGFGRDSLIHWYGRCPYGVPGDTLWVREAHYLTDNGDEEYAVFAADPEDVGAHLSAIAALRAHHPSANWDSHAKLRPSIHMPRWASRITLRVTDVRVERLHEISEADAEAEGVREPSLGEIVWAGFMGMDRDQCPPRTAYAVLWDEINGARAWLANPWVWAVSFERVD